MKIKALGVLIASSMALTGCNTAFIQQQDAMTGDTEYSSTAKGAGAGALAGALIGLAKGDGGKGALKGALIGGAIGGGVGYYMDAQESKLRARMQGTDIRVERVGENQIDLVMPGYMTFDHNKSSIRPQLYRPLNGVAIVLREYPNSRIRIVGYTDNTGTEYENLKLSFERATAVRSFLTAQGIDGDRIEAFGEGEAFPVATNETAAGRQANRRVEINIISN